ncbi:hypothetical protein [uncultured Algibacter sp.]|uniref:hypothetical protein n=1 Tax=uncultured Algibacter sp. TaxID=298659 RepID=UPI0032165D04
MKFLFKDIKLQLQPINTSVAYKHTIESEVISNKKRAINSSEKILDINFISEENRYLPQINIKTKSHKVVLDSLLKKQEGMTLKMASLTDNIILNVDNKGTIREIANHSAIVQKWESLQQELKQVYNGNIFERYTLGIDKKIKDEAKLLKDFKQARLFGLLFDGLYDTPFSTLKKPVITRHKTIENNVGHIPIVVDESIFCNSFNENTQVLDLGLQGKLNTEHTYINKIENYLVHQGVSKISDFKLSAYEGMFKFNTNTGLLISSSLIIETTFGAHYKKRNKLEMNIISA